MVSTQSSINLLAACALLLQGHADAEVCGPAYHSEVAAAAQTLNANCASWAAYLANGGVWHCSSTCHQSIVNLVDTLPDCQFGGPYGQNYKNVVKGLVASGDNSTETTDASAPATTAPSATSNSDTKTDTNTEKTNTASSNGSAGVVSTDIPSSDISTTSGASSQSTGIVSHFTAALLLVAGALMQ
ncbi:Ganglioside-induced differentiation-associated protein 2 [Phytophthora boehmeriae]|uniref:Ganglioside-induced differentiation-associated protein 2 n=1 Tax=Phytophthora boehmeriae TaxID=109152 RepID=A0A8T1VK45_9STRA|nr:Ganglioside-induced differentiation-associated protein 2 [Phytophthora boehmeriae]